MHISFYFLPLWLLALVINAAENRQDARYFKHGSQRHEIDGATCAEFVRINAMDTCCTMRDDDCYMIHYDTRCYCDVFCNREIMNDHSDCCPDAYQVCSEESPVLPLNQTRAGKSCYKKGVFYEDGQTFELNCNKCHCSDGDLECSENSCLINTDMLEEINRSRLPWTAGNYSFLWAKTLEFGYKHRLGTRLTKVNQIPLDVEEILNIEQYDFRQVNQAALNRKIQDQGDCGASWAFSTIDVIGDRLAKVNDKRGNDTASVQMLISCSILPQNANGCSPATVDTAWRYISGRNGGMNNGLVNEECYPFESGQSGVAPECRVFATSESKRTIDCPSAVDLKMETNSLITSGAPYPVKVESANDIMEEIYNNGPVQVVFKVYEDFFMYKSGIYSRHPRARVLNVDDPYHSVKVLGWGSENNVDYWIASNSWGEDWGENGYFRIIRSDRDTEFGRHVFGGDISRRVNTKNNKNSIQNMRRQNFKNRNKMRMSRRRASYRRRQQRQNQN